MNKRIGSVRNRKYYTFNPAFYLHNSQAAIMKKYILLILSLLLILSSCREEKPQNPVMAGEYSTDFIFYQFYTPLTVELKYDSTTNYYSGTDSIDVNLDGNYDLIIKQHLQIPHLSDTPTNQLFPYCKLTPKNGLELAVNIQAYPAGFGTYKTVEWVDSINFQERIDEISDWSESSKSRYMWSNAPDSFVFYNGFWYEVTNSEMYIGLRMKINSDYKYGWIKVKVISREDMRFLSYALEK